jgi:hypothetical protein
VFRSSSAIALEVACVGDCRVMGVYGWYSRLISSWQVWRKNVKLTGIRR